jgi:hypothetical protein
MRRLSTALAAAFTVSLLAAVSVAVGDNKSDKAAGTAVSGVLIAQAFGATMLQKDDPEKAAAGHPKSCATKEA